MAERLDIPDRAYSIVYKAIVDALKADATLSSVFKPTAWTTWMGDATQNSPFESSVYPWIVTLPTFLPASSETQTRQSAPFGVRVIIAVAGLDVRDLMNLWGAVEDAVFPGDGSKTLNHSIRTALEQASVGRGRFVGTLTTIRLGHPALNVGIDQSGVQKMTAEGLIIAEAMVGK